MVRLIIFVLTFLLISCENSSETVTYKETKRSSEEVKVTWSKNTSEKELNGIKNIAKIYGGQYDYKKIIKGTLKDSVDIEITLSKSQTLEGLKELNLYHSHIGYLFYEGLNDTASHIDNVLIKTIYENGEILEQSYPFHYFKLIHDKMPVLARLVDCMKKEAYDSIYSMLSNSFDFSRHHQSGKYSVAGKESIIANAIAIEQNFGSIIGFSFFGVAMSMSTDKDGQESLGLKYYIVLKRENNENSRLSVIVDINKHDGEIVFFDYSF